MSTPKFRMPPCQVCLASTSRKGDHGFCFDEAYPDLSLTRIAPKMFARLKVSNDGNERSTLRFHKISIRHWSSSGAYVRCFMITRQSGRDVAKWLNGEHYLAMES